MHPHVSPEETDVRAVFQGLACSLPGSWARNGMGTVPPVPHVIHVPGEGWIVLTEDVSPQQRMSSCSALWKARPPLRMKKKGGENSPGPHRPMLRYLWCSPQAV